MQATPQQIGLLQHTLGLRIDRREPYRNYFVAGQGHHDMPGLEALEGMGLMARARTPKFCDQSDIVFCTTDAGRALALEALPEPPKHTKYQEFVDADGCWSFGEYLCGGQLPKFETRGDFWCRTKEYRMYRTVWDGDYGRYRDVEGQWARTKKAAKASYKQALAKKRAAAKEDTP